MKPVRVPSRVSEVRVDEPDTHASPAFLSVFVTPTISLLPAGPTVARTFWLEASAWAPLSASAVPFGPPSIVSSVCVLFLVLCVALYFFRKYLTQRTCWPPTDAAGPVTGTMKPSGRVLPHLTRALPALDAAAARFGALLDPQAAVARTATPAATSAATSSFLILSSFD